MKFLKRKEVEFVNKAKHWFSAYEMDKTLARAIQEKKITNTNTHKLGISRVVSEVSLH